MVDFLRHPVNILLVGIGGDEAVVKKFKKCSGHGSLWYQRMREKSTRGVALAIFRWEGFVTHHRIKANWALGNHGQSFQPVWSF